LRMICNVFYGKEGEEGFFFGEEGTPFKLFFQVRCP
jgi:hypothetical protein